MPSATPGSPLTTLWPPVAQVQRTVSPTLMVSIDGAQASAPSFPTVTVAMALGTLVLVVGVGLVVVAVGPVVVTLMVLVVTEVEIGAPGAVVGGTVLPGALPGIVTVVVVGVVVVPGISCDSTSATRASP